MHGKMRALVGIKQKLDLSPREGDITTPHPMLCKLHSAFGDVETHFATYAPMT